MPVIASLVSVSTDHLFYLVRSASGGGEFPVFGGSITLAWGTLQSDGLTTTLPSRPISGQFLQVVYANLNGIGLIPAASGLTVGQARALFLVDQSTNVGNDLVPRAETTITPRDAIPWTVDTDTTGVVVTAPSTTAGGFAYLRIRLRHSLWR